MSSSTRYELTCPACLADVSLSARRLTLRIDEDVPPLSGQAISGTSISNDRAPVGEVLFQCLCCDATVAVPLDVVAVDALVAGGVTRLRLSEASVGPDLPFER